MKDNRPPNYPLRLAKPVMRELRKQARKAGLPVNQYIAALVEERILVRGEPA